MKSPYVFFKDEGTLIEVDARTDLTGATITKLRYKKPSGATGEWDASLYQTQYLRYTTQADDLDEAGDWLLQAYVELPSGKWHGTVAEFEVRKHFIISP